MKEKETKKNKIKQDLRNAKRSMIKDVDLEPNLKYEISKEHQFPNQSKW